MVARPGICMSASVAVPYCGAPPVPGHLSWNTDPVLNSGRLDINGGTLLTGDQPFNLTKVGLNQVTLRGCTVDAQLANIDVQAGLLALQGGTSSLGNPSSNPVRSRIPPSCAMPTAGRPFFKNDSRRIVPSFSHPSQGSSIGEQVRQEDGVRIACNALSQVLEATKDARRPCYSDSRLA